MINLVLSMASVLTLESVQALEKLSKQRPQSSVFNFYVVISVLGQAAVHIAALVYIRQQAIDYSEDL